MNNAVRFISYLSSGPVSPPRAPNDRRHSKVSPEAGPVARAISLEKSPTLILFGARLLSPLPMRLALAVRRAPRTEKVLERSGRGGFWIRHSLPSHIPRF